MSDVALDLRFDGRDVTVGMNQDSEAIMRTDR